MTATTTSGTDIWRRYEDRPVLTPNMIGGHRATPPHELARLRRYLAAVVADRSCPVHTTVAFNAAYFGYELGGEGYGNGPFDLDGFPVLALGDQVAAQPVGALVRIETGSDPLYAEIVYKEGRPRTADDGEVPARTPGAPAPATARGPQGPPDETFVRRELLVPDLTAFGPALQLDEKKLTRLRTRGRWLNEDGHVVVDVRYAGPQEAAPDDTAAFVDHLLAHQREALLSPLVPVSVAHLADGTAEERLRGALTGLVDVIAHALRTTDSLRAWGPYALTRERIGAGLRQDGPLGASDLHDLAGSLERAAAPGPRRRHGLGGPRTERTAIAPWLRAVTGAGPLLTGTEYAVSVCRANLAVADFLRGDTDNGLCARSGVRITLDDRFENGGVWRSHHPGSERADGTDPLAPEGPGRRDAENPPAPGPADLRTDSAPQPEDSAPPEEPAPLEDSAPRLEDSAETPQAEAPPVEAPLADDPLTDEEEIGLRNYLRIHDSELCWQQPLRLAHILENRLPLNRMARSALASVAPAADRIRLELHHAGVEIDPSEEVQEVALDLSGETGMLHGVQWPIDFFAGLRLWLQWPRGGTVLRLFTRELEQPSEIDGRLVTHEYDPQVLTRDGAPGSSRDGDSPRGLDTRQLVLRAVRRCGLLTPDGHALLDRDALPRGVHAAEPAPHQVTAVERAVEELLAERHLYAAVGSRGTDGEPHHPARDGEHRIPLVGYAPRPVAVPRQGPGGVHALHHGTGAEYTVHGFLRRLPAGSEPSDYQRAAYRDHCRHAGKADGWELPRGYTFVTPHSRRR
ncbi:hypothetical protein ACFYOG_34505 [Streptomyces sp. NPDC007818]|uniref:hypothetical protein n=1 Tax=Streptomyces sp. NPDC007818 TaxID=3364780 RepID=UPI0036AC049B